MKSHKKIVLILGNPLNHEGGMVAFNKGLISALNATNEDYLLSHFSIGSRMSLFYKPILKRVLYPFLLLYDIFRLCIKLLNIKIKVIQLNPSLIPVPLFRDGFVQLVNSIFFRKKTIIVLHGWKEHIYSELLKKTIYRVLFVRFFNSVDVIYVLSENFKQKLSKLGVDKAKIKVTSTFFYKQDIDSTVVKRENNKNVRFIYLGRVSKIKGIAELIEAFGKVKVTRSNFTCDLIGHGDRPKVLENYQSKVLNNNLSTQIKFLGRKDGKEKFQILNEGDIYIFPSYMEGCPTSVIEALASGLYVISTDVGALNDIINDRNGIKVKPKNVNELVEAISNSIDKIDEIRLKKNEIANNAFFNFEVNVIAEQFHSTYKVLIEN